MPDAKISDVRFIRNNQPKTITVSFAVEIDKLATNTAPRVRVQLMDVAGKKATRTVRVVPDSKGIWRGGVHVRQGTTLPCIVEALVDAGGSLKVKVSAPGSTDVTRNVNTPTPVQDTGVFNFVVS